MNEQVTEHWTNIVLAVRFFGSVVNDGWLCGDYKVSDNKLYHNNWSVTCSHTVHGSFEYEFHGITEEAFLNHQCDLIPTYTSQNIRPEIFIAIIEANTIGLPKTYEISSNGNTMQVWSGECDVIYADFPDGKNKLIFHSHDKRLAKAIISKYNDLITTKWVNKHD